MSYALGACICTRSVEATASQNVDLFGTGFGLQLLGSLTTSLSSLLMFPSTLFFFLFSLKSSLFLGYAFKTMRIDMSLFISYHFSFI